MKKTRILASLLSTAMLITAMPLSATAEPDTSSTLSYDGYKMVWSDEFNGTTLNRDDWNVELHEKGWVNAELQEYVDSDENIQVKDGKLIINPVEKKETIVTEGAKNLLSNADFSDAFNNWEETIANWDGSADATRSISDGQIVYDIAKAGSADWHVQLKHKPVTVEAGKSYKVSFTATSTATRTICSGVMNGADYSQHGQKFVKLDANEAQNVSYTFTAEKTDDNSIYYFSLGKMPDEDAIASKVTLSNLSLTEMPSNMLASDAFGDAATNGLITKEVTSANMGVNPWDVQIIQNGISVEQGQKYEVTFTASATTPRKVDKTGDADWKVQVKQENVPLVKGHKYKLTYKAKSSIDRDIRVIMQGGESLGWPVYSEDKVTALTKDFKTFEQTFTMNEDSDKAAFLSICLGNVTKEINDQHVVVIDDITLEDLTASDSSDEDSSDDNNAVTEDTDEPADIKVEKSDNIDVYNFIDAVNTGADVVIPVTDSNGKELYRWTFENNDIDLSKIEGMTSLDLTVEFTTAKDEKIQSLVNSVGKAVFIEIPNYNGDLPGKATLTVPVDKKYKNGQKVYLYYYNEKTNTVEKASDALTVTNGTVDVELGHCSVYFLSDKADIEMKKTENKPATTPNAKPNTPAAQKPAKAPKTGDTALPIVWLFVIALGGLTSIYEIKKLKRN